MDPQALEILKLSVQAGVYLVMIVGAFWKLSSKMDVDTIARKGEMALLKQEFTSEMKASEARLNNKMESTQVKVLGNDGIAGLTSTVTQLGNYAARAETQCIERHRLQEANGTDYSRHRMDNLDEAIYLLIDQLPEIPTHTRDRVIALIEKPNKVA
jgi:hypothetical protein